MSSDRYRIPAEPDQDAYEDAWYRALKAKASRRFRDPDEDKAEGPPAEPTPPNVEDGTGSGSS